MGRQQASHDWGHMTGWRAQSCEVSRCVGAAITSVHVFPCEACFLTQPSPANFARRHRPQLPLGLDSLQDALVQRRRGLSRRFQLTGGYLRQVKGELQRLTVPRRTENVL